MEDGEIEVDSINAIGFRDITPALAGRGRRRAAHLRERSELPVTNVRYNSTL
jgi:hypothetical protein